MRSDQLADVARRIAERRAHTADVSPDSKWKATVDSDTDMMQALMSAVLSLMIARDGLTDVVEALRKSTAMEMCKVAAMAPKAPRKPSVP